MGMGFKFEQHRLGLEKNNLLGNMGNGVRTLGLSLHDSLVTPCVKATIQINSKTDMQHLLGKNKITAG